MPYKNPIKQREYQREWWRKNRKNKLKKERENFLIGNPRLCIICKENMGNVRNDRKYCNNCTIEVKRKRSIDWYQNNPERKKEIGAKGVKKRRRTKNNIIEQWTEMEFKDKLNSTNGICLMCNKYIGIRKLALDHIYPISIAHKDYLETGIKRVYTIDNIQFLCRSCNSSKGNGIINT